MKAFGPVLALAFVLALALPLVAADHVYSHRVYVVGRVIDADGRPAAGVPVNLTFLGIDAARGCFDNKAEVTNGRGDFEVCRHAHVIPAGASVTVRVGNASREARIDPDLRIASVRLQLDAPAPHDLQQEREAQRSYHVLGRAFALLPRPVEEEGVMVNATPVYGNVTVEMRVLDRVIAEQVVTPDLNGIYRADLDVAEVPAAAVVRASLGRDHGEDVVSTAFRRTDVNVIRDLRLVEGPGDDAPGSSPTPLPAWLAIAALVGLSARARASPSSR